MSHLVDNVLVPSGNRAEERRRAMTRGVVCPPLRICHRFEIGGFSQTAWCNYSAVRQIEMQLKRLCPDLELLYDKAAAGGNGMKPSWHLYRRVRRAGVENLDTLELVFSCQRKFDKPWPTGGPIIPDSTVVHEYQKRLYEHNHAEGDPIEAATKAAKEHNEKLVAKQNQEQSERMRDVAKDIYNIGIKRGAESDTMRKIRNQQKRKATETPKTTSAPGIPAS